MVNNLELHRAQLLVKAALLGLLAAHATDEAYPDSITVSLQLDDGVPAESMYQIEAVLRGRAMPVAGGSL